MLARALVLFAVVVWGWTFVATKICLDYMGPLELLGLRLLIACPVLLAIIVVRGVSLRMGTHRRSLALGAVLIGLHFYIQISGIQHTSATNTGWIIAVSPLVIALLAALFLGETLHRGLIAGISVATLGILLLVSRGRLSDVGRLASIGDWLVLASAHTWALYTIVVRDASRSGNPLGVTLWVLTPACVVCLGWMSATSDWSRLTELPAEPVAALIFLGVFGMAFAQWAWQVGIARIGAAQAGMFLYVEPLATTGLAVPYLGESFGAFAILGGLFVLFGVWISQRSRSPGATPCG